MASTTSSHSPNAEECTKTPVSEQIITIDNEIDCMRKLLQESKTIRRDLRDGILDKIINIHKLSQNHIDQIHKLRLENANMKTRMAEQLFLQEKRHNDQLIALKIGTPKETPSLLPTWAKHHQTSRPPAKREFPPLPTPTHVTRVQSTKTESIQQVLTKVKTAVKPSDLGIAISSINTTKDTVNIFCPTKAAAQVIREKINQTPSLKATEAIKKHPRLILVGVSTDTKTEEIAKALISQNTLPPTTSTTDPIIVCHTGKNKNPNLKNVIIDVHPGLYSAMLALERVNLEYQRVRIFEARITAACRNCLMYGHGQGVCKNKPACAKCHEQHRTEKCQNPKRQGCYNCAQIKKPNNHKAGTPECPIFARSHSIAAKHIDYGV